MKYKVLYRKYRPDNFDNIIGQEYIIKTLKNSIITNHISHAYIFSGPRGTGKTTTAKVFSNAINCLNPKEGSPCGECDFCKNFNENPDIIEIDAASNNGVDEIRNLIENVKLTPTNGKYKVYIIDEVHMLSTSAFNALLLTLEEPPAHTVFILATTNIENVPITILSRCQRFDFQKIKNEDIVKRLKEVCTLEGINATDDALKEIAFLSEGGMRDALSLLDQLSKNGEEITLELIEKQIKTISQKGIYDLLETIENNRTEDFLNLINEYRERAVDYKSLIKKIIDIASVRAKNIKLTNKFNKLNFDVYREIVLKLAECLTKININVDPYTILEMTLLDFFREEKIDEKPVIVEEKEEKVDETTKTEEVKESESKEDIKENVSDEFIKIRINNTFAGAQKKILEEVKSKVSDYLLTATGKVKSIMMDSNIVAASNDNLILTNSNEHLVNEANANLSIIEASLESELNHKYKIIFISPDRWEKERNMYIENIKKQKKYSYIEEGQVEEKKESNPMLNDVFNQDKVEIV